LFLQGEEYDLHRDVVFQLPPEAGYKPWIAARLKKPAYGMNDAPRRWWNKIDTALRNYGMGPTRADLCTYLLYSEPLLRPGKMTFAKGVSKNILTGKHLVPDFEAALAYLLDPAIGSAANNRKVLECSAYKLMTSYSQVQAKCTSKSSIGSGRSSRWAQRTRTM